MRFRFAVLLSFGLAGCAATPAPLPAPDPGPRTEAVHVLSNGWHTAVVLARADVAASGALPEAAHFPDAAFFEFSWGDRAYFMAPDPSLGMTLEAALVPTPAVMHLVGLALPPRLAYPEAEVVTVNMSRAGLRRLIDALAGQFERPDGASAAPISRGLVANSHFYPAQGRFHLFNTCNTWTARKLRTAGVDVSPSGVVTADELMQRLHTALENAH